MGEIDPADDAYLAQAKQFGDQIRNLRLSLGLSQPELAAKLQCKRQTISSWEQGQTSPDVKVLFQLKEIARTNEKNPLDVDLGDMLGDRRGDAGATPLEYTIGLLQKMNSMGIREIHSNRADALMSFISFLESERESISIVASSFLGVTRVAPERVAAVLSRKPGKVKQFRVLMTHPEMSQWREKQEGRADGSIRAEISESVKVLESWGVRSENIRFWRGAPTIFLLFTPQRMLANPYTYQTEAFKSVTFEVAPTGSPNDVFSHYSENHFKRPWESPSAVSLEEVRKADGQESPKL